MAAIQKRRMVLYSGGQEKRNSAIHERLIELALHRPSRKPRNEVRMSYVPFVEEGARPYYQRFMRRYRRFGATHFECIPPDRPELRTDEAARRRMERVLLASDIIYLSGGNTFTFLHHLRRSGLLKTLERFARRGGVIAGLSAGGILMTPHIGLAGYPEFDRDENEIGLTKRGEKSLGLVNFEFFPHYRNSPRYRNALQAYSRNTGVPLYACRDGSGIVLDGDCFTAHGDVWLFDRGQSLRIGD
ncbi:MAG: Type 1 glutamine amidotransferase-like domain-containing protein [Myxococcota bacterium]